MKKRWIKIHRFDFHIPLFIHRRYDAAAAAVVAKLAEVYALPGAEVEAAIGDGDGEAYAEEGALGVGGHVVGTLHGVVIVGLVLSHEAVHNLTEVSAHIGVGILVDGQCARGVLHEEVEQACLWQRVGEMLQYLACDEVASAALGREAKGGLLYHRVAKVRISERKAKLV